MVAFLNEHFLLSCCTLLYEALSIDLDSIYIGRGIDSDSINQKERSRRLSLKGDIGIVV